jgi:hypothetical protein
VLLKNEGSTMFNTSRALSAALLAAGLATAAPAFAQPGWYGNQHDRDAWGWNRDADRRASDIGYREGFEHGRDDARRGRDFAYAHDDAYRNADIGWQRGDGDIERYRQSFRRAYVDGYSEGYRGIRGGYNGSYPRQGYPVYRGNPNVYERGDRAYGSWAASIGYRDGLDVGRADANDRETFNPQRSKRYKQADHDYDNRYGSKDLYRQEYRSAFVQGYEDGYRGFRR